MEAPRILVVEDEPLVALDLTETLRSAGYTVGPAVDSADHLFDAVRQRRPDLILMDIRLRSFLDGVDAVQRLRLVSATPVIYLTAYSTPDVVRRAEGTKAAAFLVKPVDPEVLLAAVRKALPPPAAD